MPEQRGAVLRPAQDVLLLLSVWFAKWSGKFWYSWRSWRAGKIQAGCHVQAVAGLALDHDGVSFTSCPGRVDAGAIKIHLVP